jgi:hypothetical protein
MKKKSKPLYKNLFPEEYKGKTRRPRRLLGLSISAAIIAAILTGSTLYFENIKHSYEKNLENIRKTYLDLSKNAAVIEKTKRQRADFYKRRYYIDFPLEYSFAAANFVRQLSLLAMEKIELEGIEINPANQSFTFLLSGRIKAGSNIEARSKFRRFYQGLKQWEDLLRIESPAVKVNPRQTKPGLSPRQPDVELHFTIEGEVETGVR